MDLRTTVSLLPTPRASDGEHGGPNQRGSKGDLALPAAVVQLLPTPTVADSRDTANYRPDGTPYGSGNGMTLTDAGRLLLTGAASPPPSSDGSTPPDARRHEQLTIKIG